MEKAKKAEVVEDLNGVFAKAGSVVVAHYSGMTVAQMGDLRSRMRASGASFRVAKNRLAVRALKGTADRGHRPSFQGADRHRVSATIRWPLRRWRWPTPRTTRNS